MNLTILNGINKFQVQVPLATALANKTVVEGSIISRNYLKWSRDERQELGRLTLRRRRGRRVYKTPTWRFVPFSWQGKDHRVFFKDLIGIPTGHEISLVKRAIEDVREAE